jgi:hypothetical protein
VEELKTWKIILAFLLITTLIFVAAGCDNTKNPDDDPGLDPGEDPSLDPGEDPGEDPGPDPGDPLAVTPVPEGEIGLVDKAVIHLGDLWLGSANGLWRQTDSGDVTEIVWAPDGHGLIYFRETDTNIPGQDLYYLALGEDPVLLERNVQANKAWLNKNDWLWNPDSDSVAYALDHGTELVNLYLQDMTKTRIPITKPYGQGPYWLSNGLMVYGTATERPEVIVINAIGGVQGEVLDATLPYPLPEGMIIAVGEYDPDGIMDTFFLTGLARANDDGSGPAQVCEEISKYHLLARDPVLPGSLTLPRYLAISSPEALFLQKYAGIASKGIPNTVELLTQDVFVTYSEFSYPFWFAWAPDGSYIAALPFTLTQPGDVEQEGYWDLVLVDEKANRRVVLENIYSVKGFEMPVPFQYRMPLNWAPDCTHINYLQDRADEMGQDWWQVDIDKGVATKVLEKSGLPEYRPQP